MDCSPANKDNRAFVSKPGAESSLLPPALTVETQIISPPVLQDYPPQLRRRHRIALIAAVLIDSIQLGLFPVFSPGFFSIANNLLDGVAFLFFWRLLGWHWSLLPGFVFEFIPFVDLAPTWTLAVCLAIRNPAR